MVNDPVNLIDPNGMDPSDCGAPPARVISMWYTYNAFGSRIDSLQDEIQGLLSKSKKPGMCDSTTGKYDGQIKNLQNQIKQLQQMQQSMRNTNWINFIFNPQCNTKDLGG